MGFPIIRRAILERIPKNVLKTPFARAIHRKGGARTEVVDEGVSGTLPIPILSLEGAKAGCSEALQSLIRAYRDNPTATNREALLGYIEDHLGQTIEDAYPDEWALSQAGERQTLEIDLGTDTVTLTIGICNRGTIVDPGPCLEELQSLVDALNASPTEENSNALEIFVENQTGVPIEELVPAWNEVLDDGAVRTAEINVCDAILRITISGDLQTEETCLHLPSYGVSFPQNDFDLPTIVTSTYSQSSARGTRYVYTTYPDITVHLEEPEFVYLNTFSDPDLLGSLSLRGYGASASGISDDVSGISYGPFLRVRGSWTSKVAQLKRESLQTSSGGGIPVGDVIATEYIYTTEFPLMGFHRFYRYASGESPNPTQFPLTPSDPLVLGEFFTEERAAGEGDLPSNDTGTHIVRPISTSSGVQSDSFDGPDLGDTYCYWLPGAAYGDNPTSTADNEPTIINTEGSGATSYLEAWTLFTSQVADYQNLASEVYDPQLTLDEENMEVTVTFDMTTNAMYLPLLACGHDPLVEDFPSVYPFSAFAASWGSYWHDTGWTVGHGPTSTDIPVGGGFGGYTPNDLGGGGWLSALNARILHDYPEDNTGYFQTGYRRTLPIGAGDYLPIIEAGIIDVPGGCDMDARCITPGPP